MLYPIKDREDLQNSNELALLKNQLQEVRLQDKLGEQNFCQNRNKLFEPMTDAIKNTSQDITKTVTETFIKNNKVLENLNENVLEMMNDKGKIAPNLATSLVNIFKLENNSQFR